MLNLSHTEQLTSIISNQSTKLDSLMTQLDNKLKDLISTLPAKKQLEIYDKMSKQYSNKLDKLKK